MIDTSIGEISAVIGTAGNRCRSVVLRGEMVGTVDLDLSDLLSGLGAVSITYDGCSKPPGPVKCPRVMKIRVKTELP